MQLQHVNVKLLVQNPAERGPRAADPGISQLDSKPERATNCCSTSPITATFPRARESS